jgi:hypothetical protein
VPLRALKARELDEAEVRHLLHAGLSTAQVDAIKRVGIGADELNELILNGLPPQPPTRS